MFYIITLRFYTFALIDQLRSISIAVPMVLPFYKFSNLWH